ncbi:MAG: glycerate kinase [Alphaproteobacteria bacterium]|nr:glycerate kinase [Alphaproteobacteria bacterium]
MTASCPPNRAQTPIAARQARDLLRRMLDGAIASADPKLCVPPHLPPPPKGRTIVLGAGKASAAMARAVEDHWLGPLSGLVVTRYGHGVPCRRIEIVEAAHPVPDAAGRAAAGRILELARGAGPDDLVLCLISGGGSALLILPAPGISLDEKRAVTTQLLASGATIGEFNTVRKHLSAIKGGRLAAAAAPAAVLALLISDVPGDDPATIASGPTVADPTSFADARAVLAKYGIMPPQSIAAHLAAANDETPKPGSAILRRSRHVIIARPQAALEAAASFARAADLTPIILGDAIEGEASAIGRDHARLALDHVAKARAHGPLVLLSGGETTVTVRGKGRGGRNVEYLLALALALDGAPGIVAIAADTDGIDGMADNAGAIVIPDGLARARAKGRDPAADLANNDGHSYFEALDDHVVTGPTLTNVNDFRAILIAPPG